MSRYPKIIAANWKMHKTLSEGMDLTKEIIDYLETCPLSHIQLILFPSFIHLAHISNLLASKAGIYLGAQNCHDQIAGAFTGEVSAAMLASVGVKYILVGHSERRNHFRERNDLIARKINANLSCNLQPVFCCGESLAVRESNQQYTFIRQQMMESLFHLNAAQIKNIIIAYEPIWAIGTGITPSIDEIKDMQQEIRDILATKYNTTLADKMVILYGGSCNANNILGFMHIDQIDGVLIGNASLHVKEFLHILDSLQKE